MPSPVTPNEIKNTLPNVDSGVCDRLKKVIIDFPRKVYAWMSYVYNDDGTFTEEFKQELCAVKCDDKTTVVVCPIDPPPNGGDGGAIKRVTDLIATPATRSTGGIALIWQHVPNAAMYSVYRTPTITVDHASSGSTYAANATNIKVEPLIEELSSGKKITFDGGTVLTLTADAIVGATALAGTLSGTLDDTTEGHLSAADATLIIKDGTPWEASNHVQVEGGHICKRTNGTILFLDEHGGKIWDGSSHVNIKSDGTAANVIDGQRRYNYWVAGRTTSGQYSSFSNTASGFSKYVKGFTAVDGDTGLIYSGGGDAYYDQTVPTSPAVNIMRVVLRGGGGAGGAGGDHKETTAIQYYVKTLSYAGGANDTFTFTLGGSSVPNVNHWLVGDKINLKDNGNSNFDREFIVSQINGNSFVCKADTELAGESPSTSGTIPATSDASHGRVYRLKDIQAVAIPGGGGGAGGFLIAVFNITSAITKVRVKTVDSTTGTALTVNYSNTGSGAFYQLTTYLDDVGDDNTISYNKGGDGRQSNTVAPTAGEPHASDATSNVANTVSYSKSTMIAPYFTLFEVYNGSSWLEVARVADGVGGGYRDGFTDLVSTGGAGGVTYSTTNVTGCTVRTTALSQLTGAVSGKFFKEGYKGTDGATAKYHGPNAFGTPGSGGFVWDGLRPIGHASPLSVDVFTDGVTRPGVSFDLNAPGSGGSGSKGSSEEKDSKNCKGGHAMAGCAWVTYAPNANAYDKF